jgi:hypothetical protein
MLEKRNPRVYSIGGRQIGDITQLGFSLNDRVKNAFPLNEVPQTVVDRLDNLQALLELAEQEVFETIKLVQSCPDQRDFLEG